MSVMNLYICVNILYLYFRYCDAVIMFQNDELLKRLQKPQRTPEDSGVSIEQVNKHLASCLAGVFLPTDSLSFK